MRSAARRVTRKLVHPRVRRNSGSSCASSAHCESGSSAIQQLPPQFLRDSDTSNYDANTLQRNDVTFDCDNGKPESDHSDHPIRYQITNTEFIDDVYQLQWEDGHISEYSVSWVQKQLECWTGARTGGPEPWSGLTEHQVRTSSTLALSFNDLLSPDGMSFALRSLYTSGILLVTATPTDDDGAAIAAMASCLGGGTLKNRTTMLHSYRSGSQDVMLPRGTDGPLRTLYGTVWSTTSAGQEQGASVADSAYGHDGLPLHTDMTYMRDPPGLQIFTMLQPSMSGGESLFGDGLAAAERLRALDKEAFETLATTVRRYRSIDKTTGWHLEADGPVISLKGDQVVGIRHNDLDRLPDLPPIGSSRHQRDEFYEKLRVAHKAWDQILGSDDIRLEMSLQKGDTMIVANQRCFHGRKRFSASPENPRAVAGCYVSQDELNSRFRMQGLCVL